MTETSLTADPEKLFPPKPGGMVDTARKQMAAEQAQLDQLAAMPEAPARFKTDVPVNDRAAELARARTFSVSTGNNNPIVELLGRDLNRRNAVVMTLDEPVVISFAQTAAEDPRNEVNAAGLSANGFVLPVNVPVTISCQGVIYCTATSATATRVSVMAFSYAES
jgi:hypothetical protein